MKQDIEELIKNLASCTVIDDPSITISRESKASLAAMRELIDTLSDGNDPKKQEKMIVLFMGGVLLALHQEDTKYRYSSKLYPRLTVKDALRSLSKDSTCIEQMYAIGREALANLPQSFCGQLFEREVLLSTNKEKPSSVLFPVLSLHSDRINQLVKFCITNKELAGFYVETNNVPKYSFESTLNFAAEFSKRHKKSYEHQGFFGGFFNRTTLKPYDQLTADQILAHAKERTFFGFKNRTCKILEEMEVINSEGSLIKQDAKQNNRI